MLIQYYLADGQEIRYETGSDMVTLADIDHLAMMHAERRPLCLPTDVYMHVRVYAELVRSVSGFAGITVGGHTPSIVQVMSSVGPLKVHPMPWAFDEFLVLVGTREDYDRYDVDKIFEEIVLADCERE